MQLGLGRKNNQLGLDRKNNQQVTQVTKKQRVIIKNKCQKNFKKGVSVILSDSYCFTVLLSYWSRFTYWNTVVIWSRFLQND